MRLVILIVIWLLAAISVPVHAQSNDLPEYNGEQSKHWALASEMAQFGYSDSAFNRQMAILPDQMISALERDPDVADLEQQYPGVIHFMVTAMLPPIIDAIKAELPDIRNRLSKLYMVNYDEAELINLLRFYRSPTGQKLVNGMLDNPNVSAILEDVLKDEGTGSISESAVAQSVDDTVKNNIMPDLDKDDEMALKQFNLMPEFKKLPKVGKLLLSEVTKWLNEPMPDAEVASQALANDAVAEYIDAHDAGREPKLPIYIKPR